MSLSRDLRRSWFAPISPVPLGLYRLVFGFLVLAYGLLLFPDRFTFFSERGVVNTAAADAYNALSPPAPRLTLLHGPGADAWLTPFFLVFLLAALCLAVGYRTRLAAVLVFVGLNALHNRNPLIHNGSDLLMGIMAGYLVLAPAGAACSLDRLGRVLRGQEGAAPPPVVPWALRLMQVQVCLVYLSSALSKLSGPLWRDGTAVYYALRLPECARFPVPFIDAGHLWLVNLLTYGTVATELSLALLIWVPGLRLYVLAAGALLHLGIDYGLNVPLFSPLMVASYLLFLTPADLARVRAWLQKPLRVARLRLMTDGLPDPALAAVCFFDTFGLITMEEAPRGERPRADCPREDCPREEHSRQDTASPEAREPLLSIMDTSGRVFAGAAAVWALAWRLPALWTAALLLCVPGLSGLAGRLLARIFARFPASLHYASPPVGYSGRSAPRFLGEPSPESHAVPGAFHG